VRAWRNCTCSHPRSDHETVGPSRAKTGRCWFCRCDAYHERPGKTPRDPEATCERCNRKNARRWHAPSPLWNAVLRQPDGSDKWNVLCPVCFVELAEELVGPQVWCLRPQDLDVAPLWQDVDGRVWDREQCLWVTPEPDEEPLTTVDAQA
jgi:hypothetical protein